MTSMWTAASRTGFVLMCVAATVAAAPAVRAQSPLSAEQAAEKTIEDAATACLSSPAGQTTSGMEECSAKAYAAYDRLLNETYQAALRSVDKASADAIRASQRAWILYRDAKRAADRAPWSAKRGSMTGPDLQALEIDGIRQRILELRYYGE